MRAGALLAASALRATGATGFVGSHVLDLLLGRGGAAVHATRRWSSRTTLVSHLGEDDARVAWHTCSG